VAVREETKKAARDFTGNADYKIGDVSKELDSRIKEEVARLRNKPEYELGDLSVALDEIVKNEVRPITGTFPGPMHAAQQTASKHGPSRTRAGPDDLCALASLPGYFILEGGGPRTPIPSGRFDLMGVRFRARDCF